MSSRAVAQAQNVPRAGAGSQGHPVAVGSWRGVRRGVRRWKLPWVKRQRGTVRVRRKGHYSRGALTPRQLRRLGLRDRPAAEVPLEVWPVEPASPASDRLETERFLSALVQLCPREMDTVHVRHLGRLLLENARSFSVDPMLLAALVEHQSKCDAAARSSYGIGLAMVSPTMHEHALRDGRYRYGLPSPDGFTPVELTMDRHPFSKAALRDPDTNLYFAAGILSVMHQQCPGLDSRTGSKAHRHSVSHFIWGDEVEGTAAEEAILLGRRRMLQYYSGVIPTGRATLRSVRVGSPLDGGMRVVTSVWGDQRDGGQRRHYGVDFASSQGEPVRAVAAGTVEFSGVDLKRNRFVDMPCADTDKIGRWRMGPRGLFARIDHGDGVESLYAHLESYVVQRGQWVEPGELVGYVGRTGMKSSDAHLHLGLLEDGETIDPLPVLAPKHALWPGRDVRYAGSSRGSSPAPLLPSASGELLPVK